MPAVRDFAEPGRIRSHKRGRALRAHVALGGVAEECRIEAVIRCRLPARLCRVPGDVPLPIEAAQLLQREANRRDDGSRLPLRVHGTEEEQAITNDRAANFEARVAAARIGRVYGAVLGVDLRPLALERLGTEVRRTRCHGTSWSRSS